MISNKSSRMEEQQSQFTPLLEASEKMPLLVKSENTT
jgi:hypothetical protein